MSPRATPALSAAPDRGRSRAASMLVVAALVLGQLLLGATSAQAVDWTCKQPPSPERPGSGLVGHLDQPATDRGTPGTPYGDFSYAGQKWVTYDTGCMGDPHAATDTTLGNYEFDLAKALVAITNGMHYLQDEQGAFAAVDGLVSTLSAELYDNVFTPYVGLVLVFAAMAILVWTLRGNLARVAKSSLYILAALGFAAATYLTPLAYTGLVDNVLNEGSAQLQQRLLDTSQFSKRDALPNTLHHEIVYKNWLKGEFGDADSASAQQHGRALLNAQSCSKIEQLRETVGRAACPTDAKKAEFERIGSELSGSPEYDTFTGTAGTRVGVGFGAILQSGIYASFQTVALFALFLAKLVLRLLVVCGPIIGLVAIVHNQALVRAFHAAGSAIAHGAVLTIVSLLHMRFLQWILSVTAADSMEFLGQLTIAFVVTVLLWFLFNPYSKLKQMAAPTMQLAGAESATPWRNIAQMGMAFSLWRRLRSRSSQPQARGPGRQLPGQSSERMQQYESAVLVGGSSARPETSRNYRPSYRVPVHDPPYRAPYGQLESPRDDGGSASGGPPPPGPDGSGGGAPPPRPSPDGGGPRWETNPGPAPEPESPPAGDSSAARSGGPATVARPRTEEPGTARARPETASGPQIVRPSERQARSTSEENIETGPTRANGPAPAPAHSDEQGRRVWRVYRPSTRRVEDRGASARRPETEE